jgi:hypothetical protein
VGFGLGWLALIFEDSSMVVGIDRGTQGQDRAGSNNLTLIVFNVLFETLYDWLIILYHHFWSWNASYT